MIVVVDVSSDEFVFCRPQLLTPVVRESGHWRSAINPGVEHLTPADVIAVLAEAIV